MGRTHIFARLSPLATGPQGDGRRSPNNECGCQWPLLVCAYPSESPVPSGECTAPTVCRTGGDSPPTRRRVHFCCRSCAEANRLEAGRLGSTNAASGLANQRTDGVGSHCVSLCSAYVCCVDITRQVYADVALNRVRCSVEMGKGHHTLSANTVHTRKTPCCARRSSLTYIVELWVRRLNLLVSAKQPPGSPEYGNSSDFPKTVRKRPRWLRKCTLLPFLAKFCCVRNDLDSMCAYRRLCMQKTSRFEEFNLWLHVAIATKNRWLRCRLHVFVATITEVRNK